MTRILTIIALLFATPMLAACAPSSPLQAASDEEAMANVLRLEQKQKNLSATSSKTLQPRWAEQQKRHTINCKYYGFKPDTEAFAVCLMQQDIAAKQSAEMARLRAQAASAQRKANEAEKEASRASVQAIINSINASNAQGKANQAYRNSNRALTTDPFGVNGCKIAGGCAKR